MKMQTILVPSFELNSISRSRYMDYWEIVANHLDGISNGNISSKSVMKTVGDYFDKGGNP